MTVDVADAKPCRTCVHRPLGFVDEPCINCWDTDDRPYWEQVAEPYDEAALIRKPA